MKFKNIKKIIKRPSLWFPDGKYSRKVDDLVKDMIRNKDKILVLDCDRYGIMFVYNSKIYRFCGHYYVTTCYVGNAILEPSILPICDPKYLTNRIRVRASEELYSERHPKRLTMLKFYNQIYKQAKKTVRLFGFHAHWKRGVSNKVPTNMVFSLKKRASKLEIKDDKVIHYLYDEPTELK